MMQKSNNQIWTSEQYRQMSKSCHISKKGRLIVSGEKILPEFKSKVIDNIIKPKPKSNTKIANATKCEYNDVKFDSRLEMAMYAALKEAKIPFTFKYTFELINGFIWHNHKVRNICWTPDFVFDNLQIILDTKGYSNDTAPLKIKLCKWSLLTQGKEDWQIWIVKNKKDIPICIELLKMHITKNYVPEYQNVVKNFIV